MATKKSTKKETSKPATTKKATVKTEKPKKGNDSELIALINKANKNIQTKSVEVLDAQNVADLMEETLVKNPFQTTSELRNLLHTSVPSEAVWEIIDLGKDPKNPINKQVKVKISTPSGVAEIPKEFAYKVRS